MAEIGGDVQDLHSILSSTARDFLIRKNGEQVKTDSLKGKKIGLYFSAACCRDCEQFTPQLVEVYNQLSPNVGYEIVFVSCDDFEQSFEDCFSKMPWLAVPFNDCVIREGLDELFRFRGIPIPVMVDDHGELVNENWVEIIRSYGADAYPFTLEKMKEIKEDEERAPGEQTVTSVLVTPSQDSVISLDGNNNKLRKKLDLLVHASRCRTRCCRTQDCWKMKVQFRHGLPCKVRPSGGCVLCKKIWYLLQNHARECKESECPVPRCRDLKEHLRRSKQQSDSRHRAAVMEMMR